MTPFGQTEANEAQCGQERWTDCTRHDASFSTSPLSLPTGPIQRNSGEAPAAINGPTPAPGHGFLNRNPHLH
jgi:hypothetical protein